ncbi:MAG: siroheme synthase, partial [Thaumarchaeota archaeon]
MIINLNLEGKKIIVVGGGNEAEKRIKSILNEMCEIIVISDSVNTQISKLVKTKQVKLKKQKIENVKFILELKPDLIITTTNDKKINQKIIN